MNLGIRWNRVAGIAALALVASGLLAGTSGAAAPASDQFNAKNFSNPATGKSRYLPLVPGYQTVKVGHVNRGHRQLEHRVVTTVTDVTKEINGVKAVAVLDQDFDGGEIGEQAVDYLAEDKFGNVWSLGSYTESYEGGQFVNAADAWLAGIDGAKPGLLLKAKATPKTPPWVQEDTSHGHATASVAETNVSNCVPFKCYKKVLVIKEGGERKYFAPGVGGIRTEPPSGSGEDEVEELVNFTKLSQTGLAELSDEALKLDEHARETASNVFGQSRAAKRTL
ncbi:MAG TPA: hypothetical protein VIH82_11810 [Acidimicrobiia bacterium]